MDSIIENSTPILILLFIAIVFLQSGLDKAIDWKGNLGWLTEHFSSTFLSGSVPLMVGVIMILEIISGILAVAGIVWILAFNQVDIGLYSCILASLTLLMLLFGQRIAKDYAGAFTLTGYFIVTVFGVFLLS
ncbi:DoxX family protein [Christiangramia fulva]|uniref:DoxX family protein n=1 Tax=Christiangramia fulva TaxID=2126553 RepID=A0A2R3Z3Q8_9FLAO|nr:DoxX family protein [Christiangramia fulva]AVR44842.1 DoxX family protein [Christiangramia fulva]